MANIKKNNNTYKITVSCGYDVNGKKVRQYMTWKPENGMTEKQAEKEVNKIAVLFEQDCLKGQVTTNIKFEDFMRKWFKEYAENNLKAQTIRNYHFLEQRIYKNLGYMRMDKITPRHIQKFISEMADEKDKNGDKLSPKTIKNHIGLVSSVFNYAMKMQVTSNNPCQSVVLLKPKTAEHEIYSLEEAQQLLHLLSQEKEKYLKYVVFFTLAMYTGFRRGEILGLEWKDINYKDCIITVNRTSNWAEGKGVYTDTPKTKTSTRSLKLPTEIIDLLLFFQDYQNKEKFALGDKWVEHDRLFTRWNGLPMNMNTPHVWYVKFCNRHNFRYVNIHSFRHMNASLLINSGVDVKTVQTCLGHSTAVTTLQIYAHSFQTAQAVAMQAVTNAINFKTVGASV